MYGTRNARQKGSSNRSSSSSLLDRSASSPAGKMWLCACTVAAAVAAGTVTVTAAAGATVTTAATVPVVLRLVATGMPVRPCEGLHLH